MFKQRNDKNETDLLEAQNRVNEEMAFSLGRNSGRRNIPEPVGGTLNVHIAPIRAAYKNMLARHVKKATGKETGVAGLGKTALESKQVRLQAKLDDLDGKQQRLMSENESYSSVEKQKSPWWIHILIFSTGTFDALLTRRSLSVIESNNNVAQALILAILTGVYVALPYGLVRLYHMTKYHAYRFIIWSVCALCIGSGIMGFAILRSRYLDNVGMTSLDMDAHSSISVSPVFLALLQVFVLFIGILLASLQPSPEEASLQEQKRKVEEELEQTQKAIQETEEALEQLPDQIYRYEIAQSDQSTDSATTEARIRAMYEGAVGLFIETNINFRTDRKRPDCFDQPIPKL